MEDKILQEKTLSISEDNDASSINEAEFQEEMEKTAMEKMKDLALAKVRGRLHQIQLKQILTRKINRAKNKVARKSRKTNKKR